MITCRMCGKKCRTLGLLTRHRFKEHPKVAKRDNGKGIRKRQSPGKIAGANGPLSARDLLDILKVKRDVLTEMIAEAEKYVV